VGKVGDTVIVDLNKLEDNYGDGDLPIAIAYRKGWILLMQLDGVWKPSEVKRGLELAFKAAENIYRSMRETLKGRYMTVVQQ